MISAFHKLNLIAKVCLAYLFIVNEECSWSISHSFLHFSHDIEALNGLVFVLVGSIIANWKDIEIHAEFYALSMQNAVRPATNNLLVVAEVYFLLRCSNQSSLSLFVDYASLLILDNLTSEH